MAYQEEDAVQKLCPFTFDMIGGAQKCQGSKCFAWKQVGWDQENKQANDSPPEGLYWTKDGPSYGDGGFVMHRQKWHRPAYDCRRL